MFEKGLASVKNATDKLALEKYLVKSLCSDLVNGIFLYLASQQEVTVTNQDLNADQRVKLLGQIQKDTAEHLLPIHKALATNR